MYNKLQSIENYYAMESVRKNLKLYDIDKRQEEALKQIADAIKTMYKNGVNDKVDLYIYVSHELFRLIHTSEYILNDGFLYLFGCKLKPTRLLPEDFQFVVTQHNIDDVKPSVNAKTINFKRLSIFERRLK